MGLALGAGPLFRISSAKSLKAPNFEVDQNGSVSVTGMCIVIICQQHNAGATGTITGYSTNNNYGQSNVSYLCNRLFSSNTSIMNLSFTVTDNMLNASMGNFSSTLTNALSLCLSSVSLNYWLTNVQ